MRRRRTGRRGKIFVNLVGFLMDFGDGDGIFDGWKSFQGLILSNYWLD